LQFPRSPPVVPIQERDNLTFTFRNASVERRSLTAIFLTQQPHMWLEFFHDFRRAVRRAIIHYDDFPVRRWKILLQHAHDRLLDEALVVVRIDQYAGQTLPQVAAPRKTSIA